MFRQTQRRTLLALAEKTTVHSKIQDDDDDMSDDDNDDVSGWSDEIAKHKGPHGYQCPDISCKYIVKKRSILRRHFALR